LAAGMGSASRPQEPQWPGWVGGQRRQGGGEGAHGSTGTERLKLPWDCTLGDSKCDMQKY